MRRYGVTFRPHAEADLIAVYEYIAEEAGTAVAGAYIDRIEATSLSLVTFPERGTRRDDIRPGLRIIGFEHRATIAFQVIENEVVILRIFYGGQDWPRTFRQPGGG